MGEELGPSRLTSRPFLFDENLTFIGRALRHVYSGQVVVSQDVPELGRGALDEPDLIPWLHQHGAVWVTNDWHRFRNRAQARWLYEEGVSVAWFRLTGQRGTRIEEVFESAVKAMPRLVRAYVEPGVRYVTIDRSGGLNHLPLSRLLRGNI